MPTPPDDSQGIATVMVVVAVFFVGVAVLVGGIAYLLMRGVL